MLIYFGVTPYLVFDGDNLPSKSGTEADRAKRREESRRRGLELYKAGKVSQAHQELQKAVDVTPVMARQLIEELKRLDVQYVVAPYEADAQLAYLEAKGIINGILSEDSDLLVFGAKRLLTKLDQHGDCVEINRGDFASCHEISLVGWTDAQFRRMAILSGCDYLPSINKMGLKTAYRYIRKYKNVEKVIRMLQFEGQLTIPAGYLEKYQQAELTFLHHRVFCPIAKRLVLLTDLEPGTKEEDLPYIGEDVDPETAVGVACGDLDPTTKAPIFVPNVASLTRAALVARRQTLASPADLKPNKSLDSFFKPKRQPLVELDPNSLTPSPSQQRLLAANANASWLARTTSSAPQLMRSGSSISQPGGPARDAYSNVDRATFLARASIISTYQAPKRQRLCSDTEEFLPTGGVSRSRFFSSDVEEPSPSVRKKGKSKKAKKSDFGIFSDDSLDGILLDLPENGDQVRCLSVEKAAPEPVLDTVEVQDSSFYQDSGFFDGTQAVPESSPTRSQDVEPQQSVKLEKGISIMGVAAQSSVSQDDLTNGVSAITDPDAFQDLLEFHVRKQNEILGKTFIGQPPSRRASALSTLERNVNKVGSRPQSEPLDTMLVPQNSQPHNAGTMGVHECGPKSDFKMQKKLGKTFMHQPLSQQAIALKSLTRCQNQAPGPNYGSSTTGLKGPHGKPKVPTTPLQRLGQQAVGETLTHLVVEAPASPQQLLPIAVAESFEKFAHPAVLSTTRSSTFKGSEDLVVHNSEDENESDGAEETVGGGQAYLDLARFVFTPK